MLGKVPEEREGLQMRKSNFELLRIVAMFLIVTSHYAGWIQPQFSAESITFNRVLNQTLCFGGGAGNILFFLISGYFWKDNSDNKKRIFKLWIEMFFYSILCMILAAVVLEMRGIRSFLAAALPFSHGEYWFMTAYLVIMLLMPWMNILIRNLDKKTHQKLLVVLFMLTSIIPTIPGCPTNIISDVGFYFFIYLIGVYLRQYPGHYLDTVKFNLMAAMVLLIGLVGTVICFDLLGMQYSFIVEYTGYFLRMQSPLVIFWALSVFRIFGKIKMNEHKFINYISGSVLGVYLIHSNKNIRDFMWKMIFKNVQLESPYMFVHLLCSVVGIFVVCIVIDLVRREFLEKPLWNLVEKKR